MCDNITLNTWRKLWKVQRKDVPFQDRKACRGMSSKASHIPNFGITMGVSGQLHSPAALPPPRAKRVDGPTFCLLEAGHIDSRFVKRDL